MATTARMLPITHLDICILNEVRERDSVGSRMPISLCQRCSNPYSKVYTDPGSELSIGGYSDS